VCRPLFFVFIRVHLAEAQGDLRQRGPDGPIWGSSDESASDGLRPQRRGFAAGFSEALLRCPRVFPAASFRRPGSRRAKKRREGRFPASGRRGDIRGADVRRACPAIGELVGEARIPLGPLDIGAMPPKIPGSGAEPQGRFCRMKSTPSSEPTLPPDEPLFGETRRVGVWSFALGHGLPTPPQKADGTLVRRGSPDPAAKSGRHTECACYFGEECGDGLSQRRRSGVQFPGSRAAWS